MKVYQTAYTNVMKNMTTIKSTITTLMAAYEAEDYYGTGKAAFTIAHIALPTPAAEELFLQ